MHKPTLIVDQHISRTFKKCISLLVISTMLTSMMQPLSAAEQVNSTTVPTQKLAQLLSKPQATRTASAWATESPAATTGLIAVEQVLKSVVPEVFAGIQENSSPTSSELKSAHISGVTLKRAAEKIVNQLDSIEVETQNMRRQLALDLARMQNAASATEPNAMLVKRHVDTAAEFEKRAAEFSRLSQAVKGAQGDDIKAKLQALAGFVVKYPNQRPHQPADPQNLPFRLAKPEVRAPIEDSRALAHYLTQQPAQKNIQVKRSDSTRDVTAQQNVQTQTNYPLLGDSQRQIEKSNVTPAQIQQLKSTTGAASISAAAAIIAPAAIDLAQTEDVQLTPAIRAKAAELHYNPLEIYNFVRNSTEYLPTYGSIQGSDMTLTTGRGNAYDTASLTIALLRASGIYARYVYGTVEIPAAQVQNWVGNVKSPEVAQNLMSQGGIPNVALVSGGKIAAFRLEHVWVEAYVNYFPSRGAKHTGDPANSPANPRGTPGDTWVPMDASFKQFLYSAPLDIIGLAGIDINAMRSAASAGAVIDPAGAWVQGINGTTFAQSFEDAQHQALSYLAANRPTTTAEDLLGKRSIIREDRAILPATLRFPTPIISLRTAELPAALRWTIDVGYYGSEVDLQLGSPTVQTALSLPRLNVKRLGVKPIPATQTDADALSALAAQSATQLNPYAINVKPQLQLDGAQIIEAPAQRMGDTVYWSLTINGPGQSPIRADYKLNTGDEVVFGVNAIGIDTKQHQSRHALVNTVSASNNLQQVALAFWAQHDIYDEVLAATVGMATLRLPSAGAFATRLNVGYSFGIPRIGYYQGRSMDVKQNVRAYAGGTSEQTIKVAVESGIHGSYLEGFTFDMLFNHERGTGLSAAGILQTLQAQGAKIYKIDAGNIATTLPSIQASADVKADISNAVGAGQYAVIAEREIAQGGWKGAGYYLIDPNTGAGAYRLSGGFAGGEEGGDCQSQPATQPASNPTSSLFVGLLYVIGIIFLAAAAAAVAPVVVLLVALVLSTSAAAATPPPVDLTPLNTGQQAAWDQLGAGRFPTAAPEVQAQTCEAPRKLILDREKNAACNNMLREKCTAEDCKETIDAKVEQRYQCIAARIAVMTECFGGGNWGHWKQIQDLLAGIDTCRACRAKAKPTGSCTP